MGGGGEGIGSKKKGMVAAGDDLGFLKYEGRLGGGGTY
jgi:hypothetical protein